MTPTIESLALETTVNERSALRYEMEEWQDRFDEALRGMDL